MFQTLLPTTFKRASRNFPSLRANHHPGWTIYNDTLIVRMREHGTGREYCVPTKRFNKAAEYLAQDQLIHDLQNQLQLPSGATGPCCRCRRKCASLFTVDFLLSIRYWYFQHTTHDDAVAELAKLIAANRKHRFKEYFIENIPVISLTIQEAIINLGVPPIFQLCVRLQRNAYATNMCQDGREWGLHSRR